MLCLSFCDISVITVDYCRIIHGMNKSAAIHLLDHSLINN